jgi:hypothetical protein
MRRMVLRSYPLHTALRVPSFLRSIRGGDPTKSQAGQAQIRSY